MEVTNNLQPNPHVLSNSQNSIPFVNSQDKLMEATISQNSSFSCCEPIINFFKFIWDAFVNIGSVLFGFCLKSKEEDASNNEIFGENFALDYSKAYDAAQKRHGQSPTKEQIDIERTKQQNRIEELD